MGHIQTFTHELRNRLAAVCEEYGLAEMPDFESVIKWASSEVLQSYRNGVEVGGKQGSAPQKGRGAKRGAGRR